MERFDGFERWRSPAAPAVAASAALVPGGDVRQRWSEAILASSALFSVLLDADGVVLDASASAIEGCGFERSSVVGRRFWEAGWWRPDPALAARVRRWYDEIARRGDSLAAVSRHFRADGSTGMLELSITPVAFLRSDGGADRHLVVAALDVTDALVLQAGRENEIAAQVAVSRQAEARLRAGLDAMLDHVTIARALRDERGRIADFVVEFANVATSDGAGRSGADLVGRVMRDLYPSWHESGLFDRFVEVVETGQPYIAHRIAYHDVLADGTSIDGFWALQVTRLDDGYLAASRNITEAVRHEEAARRAELNAARERLATEVLQDAALNLDVPDVAGLDIGVHYQPAAGPLPVGGDWYDAIELTGGRVAFIIADVAGHGPEAAAYMVQVRNILRALVLEHPEPADALSRANRTIATLLAHQRSFATCCLAVLDPASGALHWSSAGHPAPLLVSAEGAARFLAATPGPPLGVARDARYHAARAVLTSGDRLVLYTDGLIETRGGTLDDDLHRLASTAPTLGHLPAAACAIALAATLSSGIDDVALVVADLVTPARP